MEVVSAYIHDNKERPSKLYNSKIILLVLIISIYNLSLPSAADAAAVKAQGAAVAKGTDTAMAAVNTVNLTGLNTSTAYKAYINAGFFFSCINTAQTRKYFNSITMSLGLLSLKARNRIGVIKLAIKQDNLQIEITIDLDVT